MTMMTFNNILYPIDLNTENISSLIKTIEFGQIFKAQIHILYINDSQAGYRHPTDHEDAVALKVKEIAPAKLLEQSKITYAVSKGDLASEVSKYSKKNNIDLIITGHKHKNKLYFALFDSPDQDIIEAINLPVLVIPEN
jgi:nucleotide-binding universal stress UspA family protein